MYDSTSNVSFLFESARFVRNLTDGDDSVCNERCGWNPTDAADLSTQYPEEDFFGHSAWLDWPWKLHRIQPKNGTVNWELYNLEFDPNEKKDRMESDSTQALSMKEPFEKWLTSVVQSLNGKDC